MRGVINVKNATVRVYLERRKLRLSNLMQFKKEDIHELTVLRAAVLLKGWSKNTLAEILGRLEKADTAVEEHLRAVYAR